MAKKKDDAPSYVRGEACDQGEALRSNFGLVVAKWVPRGAEIWVLPDEAHPGHWALSVAHKGRFFAATIDPDEARRCGDWSHLTPLVRELCGCVNGEVGPLMAADVTVGMRVWAGGVVGRVHSCVVRPSNEGPVALAQIALPFDASEDGHILSVVTSPLLCNRPRLVRARDGSVVVPDGELAEHQRHTLALLAGYAA